MNTRTLRGAHGCYEECEMNHDAQEGCPPDVKIM